MSVTLARIILVCVTLESSVTLASVRRVGNTPGSVIPGSVTPVSVIPMSVIPGSVIPGSVILVSVTLAQNVTLAKSVTLIASVNLASYAPKCITLWSVNCRTATLRCVTPMYVSWRRLKQ